MAFNWSALFSTLAKALADYKANKPLPPSKTQPMTPAQIQAAGKALQARIAAILTFAEAHPGAIVAIDDILDFFAAQGDAWAADVELTVNAAPGVLAEAESWLPTVLSLLASVQPAPYRAPDDEPYRGR